MSLNHDAAENQSVFHLKYERISCGADGGHDLVVEAGLIRAGRVPFDGQSAEDYKATVISQLREIDCPFNDEFVLIREITEEDFNTAVSQSKSSVTHSQLALSLHTLPAVEVDYDFLSKAVRATQPDFINPKSPLTALPSNLVES